MKAYCLGSSSKGNAFVLEIGKSALLIECGLPLNEILNKCSEFGVDFSKVNCCLLTHAHKDHSLSASKIIEHNIPLYASNGTKTALKLNIEVLEPLKVRKITDDIYILPFEVEHDAPESFGYVIKSKDETILFVIDSKSWSVDLRNFKFDYVFIECNYDNKIVYAQMCEINKELENGITTNQNKMFQFKRNTKAHQSLYSCIKNLKRLNLTNCKAIFLTHLSKRYANEYKMKNSIQNIFKINTYVCKEKGGIK